MRRDLFLVGFVTVFSLFSVLEAYAQTAPDKPENFVADDVSPTKIVLQWDEPGDDGGSTVTGYKISYTIFPSSTDIVLENFTSNNVYEHTSLITDEIYIYSIWAYNEYGISEQFNQAQAKPKSSSSPPEDIAPNPPSGLTATDISPTSIELSWNKPTTNNGPPVDGYKIEVKIASGSFSILVADTASTVRTYTHTSLTTGTEYAYKVYALNSVGPSDASNEASATPTSSSAPPAGSDVPNSPRNFKASAASDTEIGLSWEVPGTYDGPPVTSYKIEFKKSGDLDFSDLVTTGAVTTYLHTGLTAGTTYSYKISAINSIGASNTVAASGVPEHTEVPTNFVATAVSPTSIVLSWNAPSQTYGFNIIGYIIERELAPGVFEDQTETTGSQTSVTLTGLQTDKTYTYVVSAKFSIGQSPPSEEASATPTATSGPSSFPPDPPTQLTITNDSPTRNTLSWGTPGDDGGKSITGYKIEVKVDVGSWQDVIANTGSTGTTYTHTNIPAGTDYSYRVSAINSVGIGLPNTKSITIEGTDTPSQVIEISADKSSYLEGDTIAISGKVSSKIDGEQVSLEVIFQNDLIDVNQVEVAQDGTFSDTIVASGTKWKLNGIYTAKAFYANSTGQTNFQFTTVPGSTPDPEPVPDPEPEEKKAPSFIDTTIDAQYYIDRYDNEPAYKAWFDANYPDYTFDEAISLAYPEPEPEPDPEPVPDPEPKSEPKTILDFVDPKQDPQYYVDRYNDEPAYKAWFDKNYPDYTIEEAVGLAMPEPKSEPKPILDFVDQSKDPNYYIDRYYNEAAYKEWFDSNYPDYTIEEAVGLDAEEDMSEQCGPGTVFKDGACVLEKTGGGGCLIATATFGSEMAPQVQQLREIRDNTVQNTKAGISFMTGFNQFYYSFSPTIADLERENPAFKEVVKISIMPLLTSLSILNFVDIDSEEKMLGYGIGIILLNLGIYFVMPAVIIERTFRYFKLKK